MAKKNKKEDINKLKPENIRQILFWLLYICVIKIRRLIWLDGGILCLYQLLQMPLLLVSFFKNATSEKQ